MPDITAAARGARGFGVDAVDHLVLTVVDVDASARFYETVCGMRRTTFDGTRTAMVFGAHKLNLNQRPSGAPATCPLDFCLVTPQAVDVVVAHLARHGVPIRLGPVPRSGARGLMTSVYILDPDENLVELASYASRR